MSGRRGFSAGHDVLGAIVLGTLDAAMSSIRLREPRAPQLPHQAEAQRSAAEAKRARKNARRAQLSPVNPPAKEA